jgi:exopolysaccharide production protein ExoZ
MTGTGAWVQFLKHPIVFEFTAGMFLGWAFVVGVRIPVTICVLLAIAGVGLLFAAPGFNDTVDLSRHMVYGIPALLIVAAFILFPEAGHVHVGRVSLEAGETSYATYLTHPFVLGGMSLVANRLGLPALVGPYIFSAVYVVIACLLCLTIGYQVHYRLDQPLTRRIAATLPSRTRPGAARTIPDAKQPTS